MILRILALLLLAASSAVAQTPTRIKPPVLKNRAEMIAVRERVAQQILARGDSVLVRVTIYVDEKGRTRQPEVRVSSGNPKADTAAMLLTMKMQWEPVRYGRRGVMVQIPVKLVRK
jgi:TonB family protein